MPHFLCPPWARASGRPLNNVFITLHLFGPPAAPARPHRRRRPEGLRFSVSFMEPQIKTPWLGEAGLPEPYADDPRAGLFPRRGHRTARGGGGRAGVGSPPGPLAAGAA